MNPFENSGSLNKDLDRDTIFGLHPAVPTGKVLEDKDEGIFFQVKLRNGLTQYARICFSFPWVSTPSENWLKKYSDSIMFWVAFEQGMPERPIIIGFFFKSGKEHDIDDFPDQSVFISEKFKVDINDKNETFKIKQLEGEEQEIEVDKDTTTVKSNNVRLGDKDADEQAVLGNKFADLFKEFIDDVGNISAITTPAGPTGPISSSPQWAALSAKYKQDIDTVLSEIVKLK